jgi:hypothetical protein
VLIKTAVGYVSADAEVEFKNWIAMFASITPHGTNL